MSEDMGLRGLVWNYPGSQKLCRAKFWHVHWGSLTAIARFI